MGYFFKKCNVMDDMEKRYNLALHLKEQIDSIEGINELFTNAFEVLYEGEVNLHLQKHLTLVKVKIIPTA